MIKLRGVEGWQKADEQTLALNLKDDLRGFPGGSVVENLPANAGDRKSVV